MDSEMIKWDFDEIVSLTKDFQAAILVVLEKENNIVLERSSGREERTLAIISMIHRIAMCSIPPKKLWDLKKNYPNSYEYRVVEMYLQSLVNLTKDIYTRIERRNKK